MTAIAGVPLRVAAYMRLSEAIRSGALPARSLMPSEGELVGLLKVSRTVVREALILLEEDGLIQSRRGIGRIVNEDLPRTGIEGVAPAESMLGRTDEVRVDQTLRVAQGATASYAGDYLRLGAEDHSWFVESVISRNGAPVILSQEHLPSENLDGQLAPIGAVLSDLPSDATVLGALTRAGIRLGPGNAEITVGVPGPARADQLKLREDEPVLIVTRRLQFASRPVYVSKLVVNQHLMTLTVNHTG